MVINSSRKQHTGRETGSNNQVCSSDIHQKKVWLVDKRPDKAAG